MTEKTRNKKSFGYEDIRVGDKLRVTDTYPHGTVVTVEGVAHYLDACVWKTAEEISLVTDRQSSRFTRTVELLSRPSMPVAIGTVISAMLKTGERQVNMVRVDKADDDDELVWLELTGTGGTFHTEDEVLEWQEMKLVAADS